jgi:hypothetical protein
LDHIDVVDDEHGNHLILGGHDSNLPTLSCQPDSAFESSATLSRRFVLATLALEQRPRGFGQTPVSVTKRGDRIEHDTFRMRHWLVESTGGGSQEESALDAARLPGTVRLKDARPGERPPICL